MKNYTINTKHQIIIEDEVIETKDVIVEITINKFDDYKIEGKWDLSEIDGRTYLNLEENLVCEADISDFIKEALLKEFESIDRVYPFDKSGKEIRDNSTSRGEFLAYQY